MANADGFPPPSPIITPVLVARSPTAYQPKGTPSSMGVELQGRERPASCPGRRVLEDFT